MNRQEIHFDIVPAIAQQAQMSRSVGNGPSARFSRIVSGCPMAGLPRSRPRKKWGMHLVLWMSAFLVATPYGVASGPLVSRGQAASQGLHRAWFTQIAIDAGRHRVQGWLFYQERLYVATTTGTVHALNAETGAAIWSVCVGQSDIPTLGPAVSGRHLAVVSGSTLVLLDRHDGRIVWSRRVGSAPSSSPAISRSRVYVALLNGRVEAYRIDAPDAPAWFSQSIGRIYRSPTAASQSVSWSTDKGYLYVSRPEPPNLIYRIEFDGEVIASPTELKTCLLIGSMDSNLYCIDQSTGGEHWRYATGYPIVKRPVAVGGRIYVTSRQPMLHALEASTGVLLWKSADITRFVAQGKDHVYGMDRYGDLVTLDPETGGRLGHMRLAGSWRAERGLLALSNDQSDRIFLVSDTGLVQCLHEIGLAEPIRYRQPVEQKATEAEPVRGEDGVVDETDPLDQPSTSDGVEPAPGDAKTPEDAPATEDPFEDLANPFGE